MHFRRNFKKFGKGYHFIVKSMQIKNICNTAEIHKDTQNLL